MSEKAERRQLKQQIGETAAGAMAECRDEVLKVRATGLQLLDAVQGCDERTKVTAQRVDASLKLGFANERCCQERWDATGTTQKRIIAAVSTLEALAARGFIGRFKWLVIGR